MVIVKTNLEEQGYWFVDEFIRDLFDAFYYNRVLWREIISFHGTIIWDDISDSETRMIRWEGTYNKERPNPSHKPKPGSTASLFGDFLW